MYCCWYPNICWRSIPNGYPVLAKFGSEHVKETFLRPSIAGDYVACLGVSEPQAGSDVAQIKTTAKRDGDDLIINGQKM